MADVISLSRSKESQDLFVLSVLDKKREGSFLEVGAGDPKEGNNTIMLEEHFGWNGLAVELNHTLAELYNDQRDSFCIPADATCLNYRMWIRLHVKSDIVDYLQIDTDPPRVSLISLLQVLQTGVRFRVITFEHDAYWAGDLERRLSREILMAAGYKLVIGDVSCLAGPHEDWWVRPELMPSDTWRRFIGSHIPMARETRDRYMEQLFRTCLEG